MACISLGDLWCFFFLSEPDVDPRPCPAGAMAYGNYCFTLEPLWLTGAEARRLCGYLGGVGGVGDTDTELALIGCTGAAWKPQDRKLNNVCKDNALYLDYTVMLRCF